jgi:hypothetical protein
MRSDEEKKIEKFFLSHSKRGIVPTILSLEAFCRSKGIRATRSFLRGLRYKFKFTAIFSHKRRPKHFMGMSIQCYGLLMLDRANFDYRRDADELSERIGESGRTGKRRKRRSVGRQRYRGNSTYFRKSRSPTHSQFLCSLHCRCRVSVWKTILHSLHRWWLGSMGKVCDCHDRGQLWRDSPHSQ